MDENIDELIQENELLQQVYIKGVKDAQIKNTRTKEIIDYKREKSEFELALQSNSGNFYFNYYKRFKDLPRQILFRYVYLCCFMDFNNLIVYGNFKKNTTYATEKDLRYIFNLADKQLYQTKKILLNNNLIEITEEGYIKINECLCKKGSIPKDRGVEKVRIFEETIKELYQKSTASEHKKLSLLIELLPFIHFKYNTVCYDTTTNDLQSAKCLNMKELTNLLGYSNSARLKQDLLNLKVGNQYVMSFHETSSCKIIAVNPKVYYKGNDIKDLEWLIKMFEINN